MTFFNYFSRIFVAGLSIFISCGVTIHDSHFEHALETAMHNAKNASKLTSLDLRTINESRTAHTHSEGKAGESMLTRSFTYQSPSITPNRRHHHKAILAMIQEGGRHAFDNANLPILND